MTDNKQSTEERLDAEAAEEAEQTAAADNERVRPAAEAPADELNADEGGAGARGAESGAAESAGSAAAQEEAVPEAAGSATGQGTADTESSAPEAGGSAEAAADAQQARITELERQVEEYRQRMLRAQADFENYRRRTQREKEETAKYASMQVIGGLLPVLDNFERAISASRDSGDFEALAKGVDMIFRQLLQQLEQEGLKPMETVGKPFDPEFHEAVMRVESDEHEEGIIVEELQRGYMLKDRVLRPAMVKVSG